MKIAQILCVCLLASATAVQAEEAPKTKSLTESDLKAARAAQAKAPKKLDTQTEALKKQGGWKQDPRFKSGKKTDWKAEENKRVAALKVDMSGDGKVDDVDRELLRDELTRVRGEDVGFKWDANGDGQVDEAEKEAVKKAMENKKMEWFKTADANGDGVIQANEQKASMEKWQQKPKRVPPTPSLGGPPKSKDKPKKDK